jgi:SSS family solute:Na+ symporter
VTAEQRAATRASWNRWDVINTSIVLVLILAVYIYFNG